MHNYPAAILDRANFDQPHRKSHRFFDHTEPAWQAITDALSLNHKPSASVIAKTCPKTFPFPNITNTRNRSGM
jgi:hypothetical protein